MNPLYEPGSQICAEVRQACFLDKYNDDSIAILPNAVNSFFNLDDYFMMLCCQPYAESLSKRVYTETTQGVKNKSPPPVKRVVRDAGYKPALLASV